MPNPDEYIGFLISDVARLMRTAFDRRVRELGLTRAQWMVLTRLHRKSGASQTELADMMEIEPATAGRLIDRLEAKGWVERRVHHTDRRINRIYLTREAERVHKRIWRIAEQTVDHALVDLAPRDKVQLSRLMTTVKARLVATAVKLPAAARAAPAKPAPTRLRAKPVELNDVDDEVIVP